jgi:flagellar assembly protein FliH
MARTIIRKGGVPEVAGPARGTAAGRVGSGSRVGAPVVRWQMDRIGDPATEARSAEPVPPVRPPEEELERIRDQARSEAFAEGLAAGRATGAREIAELGQLLARLREVMDGFEQELAADVMGVSLEIARQIMRHALRIHPEVVLPVIREAIASLPQGSQQPRLLLHPADAALVRSVLDANQLTPSPWRIVEDARLERGGCRVETSTSELDATVGSRWKAVVAALGSEERWVELDLPARGTSAAPGVAGSAPVPGPMPPSGPAPATGAAARRTPR